MQQELVFKINSLRKRAEKFANEVTSKEIFNEDITELLEEEIRYQIRNGEIVLIEVKGKPRTGKSTVGIAIAKDIIDDELKKCGKKEKKTEFGMRNIARDEQEYSEKMSEEDLMNDVILTDEQNELEKGGENATTEQQLKTVFSDVQAGRYIHRVSVSPEQVIDNNSDIWIETVGIDSKLMITHCRVYYRINNAEVKMWQPIGYANIYVGELIRFWEEKVKKIFLKNRKSKKDRKMIEEWSRKDFYVLYIIKKYQKMELITKYNILRPRDLPFASAIMQIIKELEPMTRHMIVDADLVQNYVEMEIRKRKLRASIIGKKLVTDRVRGVLKVYRAMYKMEKTKKREEDHEKIKRSFMESIKKQLDEFELYNKVYIEYVRGIK